ncbi:hypothetical protein GGF31_005512 [Allomyces arbusculus]|nr:hypothetical protein GGF31_005512 [Allomyces arbusculus]
MMSAAAARRPSLVAATAPGPASSTSPTTPDASPLWIDPKSPRASLARVEQFLAAAHAQSALFDDATIRAMHATLPALCSALFGSSKVLGWMHMPLPPDTERAITRFLDPTSIFFAYLLDLANDRQWVYAIHHDKLPDPTAHALRDGNLDALPDLYHARLAGASSTSTQVPPLFGKSYVELGTAANTSAYTGDLASLAASTSSFLGRTGSFLVAPTTALTTALPTVTFNMFEFFTFYFAWALANGKKAGARAPSISNDTPTSPASYLPFGSASSKQSAAASAAVAGARPDMRVSTWYMRILRAYLSYFLPTSTTTSTAPPSAKARRAAAAAAASASAAAAHHAESAPSAADNDAATASPLRHLADMASYVTSAVRGRFAADTAGPADASRPAIGYFAANVFGRVSLVPGGAGDYDRAPSRASGLVAESLAASQFFVGCLVECWLNQNAYVPPVPVVAGQPRGLDFAMLSYHAVPVDVLKGLQELVAHVSSIDLLSVLDTSVPAHFLTMNLSRFSGDVSPEKMSHIALKYAYQLLSPTIYRFLRMGMRHYAVADRSLYHLVQIWLKWITPTARGTSLVTIGDDLTARHHQFVAENFLVYSHVLVAFLDRACTFDLGVRERSPVQGAGATYVRTASEAGILYAVLDVFAPMSKQPVQRAPAPVQPAVARRRERKTSYLALGNQRVDALWRSNAQLDAARRMGEYVTTTSSGATVADALIWVRSFERVLVERSRRLHGGGAGVPASTVQLVQVLGDTIARLEGRVGASEYEPVLAQEMARPDGSARMLLQLVVRAESDRRWLLHRDGGGGAAAAATAPTTPARDAAANADTASPLGQLTGRVTSVISGYARTLAATSAGALTVRPGGGRTTPRISPAQLDEERIYYDRIASALCATFDIPDDEYAAICAQIDADAAAPAPTARAWLAAATDEPVAASLPAYVQDMTADKWHLAPSARIQLKHGMRKAPAVPRLAPGMVDRHLYFTSEVPAVVEAAYWVTDALIAAVIKGRRAVRRKRAEMEAAVPNSAGIVDAWTHRAKLVPMDALLAVLDFLATHPMTMRFVADRKFIAWVLVAVHLFVLGWRGWIVLGMMVATVAWVLAYDFDRTPPRVVCGQGRDEDEVDMDEADAGERRRRIVAVRSRATTMDTVASEEM